MPFVLAHSGHWLASVLYVVPVLVIIAWLGITTYRDRHRTADEPPETKNETGRRTG